MVELFRCAVSPIMHSLSRLLAFKPSKKSLRRDTRCHFGGLTTS
jgi:hypothetical protein